MATEDHDGPEDTNPLGEGGDVAIRRPHPILALPRCTYRRAADRDAGRNAPKRVGVADVPGSDETDVERLVHIGGPDRPKWLAILAFSLSNSILDILTLAKQGIATLGITAVKSHPIRRPFRVIMVAQTV